MSPKLYFVVASPPSRSVISCAKVLGVELEYVSIDMLKGEHMKETYLKKCPQHTVPLLEEDDGFVVADSHAIMTYMVAKYGKDDSLYPRNDLKLRAKIDHMLHFDSGILFAAAANVARPLFLENKKPSEESFNRLREAFKIADSIIALNNKKYAVADHITLADFSLTTTLTSYEAFVPLDNNYPHLKAYVERIRKLPWYKCNVEGEQIVKSFAAAKLKELA